MESLLENARLSVPRLEFQSPWSIAQVNLYICLKPPIADWLLVERNTISCFVKPVLPNMGDMKVSEIHGNAITKYSEFSLEIISDSSEIPTRNTKE